MLPLRTPLMVAGMESDSLGAAGDLRVVLPGIALCTDNAAMVAAVAAYRLAADGPTPLNAPVVPNLRLV